MKELKKQFKEVKLLFGGQKHISIEPSVSVKYQDIFNLMLERKCLMKQKYDNKIHYQIIHPLEDFEKWFNSEIKKENKLNHREWRIAIVSAIIGAVVGLISYIVSLIQTTD